MCNRARMAGEPETLLAMFDAIWATERPRDNRFRPAELVPRNRAYVIRRDGERRVLDVMSWDVLGGAASYPMTNVRQLQLPQWRRLAEDPANRCLVPLTEFCEWAPKPTDLGDGKKPVRGEMWFRTTDQPVFAVAGLWRRGGEESGFAMVTCAPNDLVAAVHPKAMITVLAPADHDRWLTGSYADALALQRPYPNALMAVRGPVFPTRAGG